ncbi:MAG: ATP-binding protein [Burkholderiales bacterium]|nr:ATP-binding protein [Burkholderiales bacterium]
MTGLIQANIEEIVNRLSDIKWQSVLFEAITNSLQAKAKNIDIKFITNIKSQLDNLNIQSKVEQVIVEDDGEGFTAQNIISFQKYLTPHKKNLGCKGVGRFFYLKKFENVHITSLDHEINFFLNKDINLVSSETKFDKTTVYLNKPKLDIILEKNSLERMIREHFIADFKLRQNEVIISVFEDSQLLFKIMKSENPIFEDKEFTIRGHGFTLAYLFENNLVTKNNGYYCAGGRVVIKNSELDQKKKWRGVKGVNLSFLLISSYFDERVNDARDDFSIYPQQANRSILNELAWEDIHLELTKQVKQIALERGINLEDIAQQNLELAIKESPYLAYYLRSNEDILDAKSLIDNARKQQELDKEKLRNNLMLDENSFQHILNIVTQSELAEYIFDRQKIIDKLKVLVDQNELENKLHDLFMKRKTKNENKDYRSNNLWLFDDRFMSYDKVFSDKQIREIFPNLNDNLERPDILSIISNTYDKDEMTDIVIIELKKASDVITPARAEEQLIDYAGYINDAYQDRKIRIWTYAFLKFDNKTERSLQNKGYNRVFTKSKFPIYYQSFKDVNAVINFIDYYALAEDAHNRNHLFMKILRGETLSNEES